MRSLLDINVIIALLDRGPVHYVPDHAKRRAPDHVPTRLFEPSAGSPGGGAARGSLQPRQPRFLAWANQPAEEEPHPLGADAGPPPDHR